MAQNPIVTIEMEDGGKIVAELYPEMAPISVNNFISLVKKGFYDGLIFHRVISGFMIQGGDPQGVGIGGPGYCIKGEFSANGVKNPLSHKRGSSPWLGPRRWILPGASSSLCTLMASSWMGSMPRSAW